MKKDKINKLLGLYQTIYANRKNINNENLEWRVAGGDGTCAGMACCEETEVEDCCTYTTTPEIGGSGEKECDISEQGDPCMARR